MIFYILLGFYLYKHICKCGPNKDKCPYKFNQFNNIHLHHWIIHTILLLILFYFQVNNNFLIGLNIGGILHGILIYDDFYIIFK